MGDVRPWHIALFALAVIVLTGSVVWQCASRQPVEIADRLVVVDMLTGELFDSALPEGRMVVFPAENPATRTRTLLPAYQQDGKWYLGGNYRPMVKDVVGEKGSPVYDAASGELTVKSPTAARKNVLTSKPSDGGSP
jgi:hypothetical protein